MTNDNSTGKPAANLEPEEARQAEIGTDGHVREPQRYVLVISTVGVIIAFALVYFFVF